MTPVVVLGDSHAVVFDSPSMKALLPTYSFAVTAVGGATVSGLRNPNAVTQAMPHFTSALQASTANSVIVMLGEVDTGFVIWYRAQKHGSAVAQMLQLAVDNYQKLIRDIRQTRQVICISTPLPTIRDGMDWGEVANLRKEVKASLAERTQLTIDFNRLMENFCASEGINYLNLDRLSVDESGRLNESLRNSDPSDHHYDPTAHAMMIAPLLAPLLEACSQAAEPVPGEKPAVENQSPRVQPGWIGRLWERISRRL